MLGAAVNAAALLAATAGLFVQCRSACCSAPTPLHPRPRCPPGATLLLLPTCCAVGGQPVYSLERPEACSCSTRVHTPALTSRGPEVGGGDWAGARWGQAGRVHTGLCNSSGLPKSPTAATAAWRTPAARPAASIVVQSMYTACHAPAVPDINRANSLEHVCYAHACLPLHAPML